MQIGKKKKKKKAEGADKVSEPKKVVETKKVDKTESGIVQIYLYGLGGGEFSIGKDIDNFFLGHGYKIEDIDVIDCPPINKHRDDFNSLIFIMTDEINFRKELACKFMEIKSIQGIRIRVIYLPHFVFFGLAESIEFANSRDQEEKAAPKN